MPINSHRNSHNHVMRTYVRHRRVLVVVAVVLGSIAGLVGVRPGAARAVPIPEHSTRWIARTALDRKSVV